MVKETDRTLLVSEKHTHISLEVMHGRSLWRMASRRSVHILSDIATKRTIARHGELVQVRNKVLRKS